MNQPTPEPTSIFAGIPTRLPDELIETLLGKPGLRIERIVSRGHRSPEGYWYDQDTHEWVMLIQGAARLRFENGAMVAMSPGAFLEIPAHRRHRVDWTDPDQDTIWLAVHFKDSSQP